MNLDTAAIWFAAVLLAFAPVRAKGAEPTTRPTTRPADCFALKGDDAGQFAFTALLPGRVQCGPALWWSSDDDGESLDNYNPAPCVTCWNGRTSLRHAGDTLELSGWANTYRDWNVIRFTLTQSPTESSAEYVIRTPVGQPDVTVRLSDRLTALLLLRHPELRPMLDNVLGGIGCPAYDPGPFVRDQLSGKPLRIPDSVADRVGVLIGLSDSPLWRQREAAIAALNGMGRDGAAALLLIDRRGMTAGEQVAVERVLGAWPVVGSPNQFRDRALERPGNGFEGR